jgi:MoaA/NifB/PqqE/SkfB family radical SAM enzyme
MSKKDAFRILGEAKKMGVFQVIIEGGEPMLYKDVFAILEYSLSLGFETNLVTNGTLISPERAKKFWQMADKFGNWPGIQVSLDSIRNEVNDINRGKGQLVRWGIENLLGAGVPISLGIVVTHDNVPYLKEIVDMYYPRIRRFHFIGLMPTWKSVQNKLKIRLSPEDYAVLGVQDEQMKAFSRLHPDLEITVLKDKDDFPTVKDEQAKIICNAGYHQIIVNCDLTVATCDIAPNMIVGDLKRETLSEVWNGGRLRQLRRLGLPPCVLDLNRDRPENAVKIPSNLIRLDSIKIVDSAPVRSRSTS